MRSPNHQKKRDRPITKKTRSPNHPHKTRSPNHPPKTQSPNHPQKTRSLNLSPKTRSPNQLPFQNVITQTSTKKLDIQTNYINSNGLIQIDELCRKSKLILIFFTISRVHTLLRFLQEYFRYVNFSNY
jgi:hypothetical protein